MSLMDWNKSLDIGVEAMNNDHKVLLKYMNELYDLYDAKADFAAQKVVLDKLKDATILHFQDEEKYMEKICFEGIDMHKIVHINLLAKFTEHYQDFISRHSFNEGFFQFLKLWLSAHIVGIDLKYAEFSRQAKKAS